VHFGANNSTNAVISADICPYKDAQRCSHHTSSEAKAVRCTTSSCDGHNDCHDERWGWLPDEWWDRLPGCTTRSAAMWVWSVCHTSYTERSCAFGQPDHC